MDAPCKIQGSIHVLLRLIHKNMCPGFWVHIKMHGKESFFYCKKELKHEKEQELKNMEL